MSRARPAAERARRAGGAGLRWAIRLLLVVGVAIGATIGFVVGVVAWILGAGAVAILAGPLIGGGVAFLAVRLGLAHGHRLAPLALWMAEKRLAGSGTRAILLTAARMVVGRSRGGSR
jgi:hypothetical protein